MPQIERISDLFPPVVFEPHQHGAPGFVYVLAMLAPVEPVFKIGRTSGVEARVRQITSVLPYDTVLLFVMWAKDAVAQEAYLHHYFGEYRLRGEWFELPESALIELYELAQEMRATTPDSVYPELLALPIDVWRMHKNWDRPKPPKSEVA
jgi:hypothetical protein